MKDNDITPKGMTFILIFFFFVLAVAMFLIIVNEIEVSTQPNKARITPESYSVEPYTKIENLETFKMIKQKQDKTPESYPNMKEFMCDMATQFPDNYDKEIYCN